MAARPDSNPLLPGINVPFLILAGAKDQIIPLEKAKAMAAAAPLAMLGTIANAGHMAMLEQPEATTKAIRDFLNAHPQSAASR
jgi:3-oxoadipate enol-lactonase